MESNTGFSNQDVTRRALKREVDLLEFLDEIDVSSWDNVIEGDIGYLIAKLRGPKKDK